MIHKPTRRAFLAAGGAGMTIAPTLLAMAQDGVDASLVSPTKYAKVLFDGKDLSNWLAKRGGPAAWKVKDGYMEVVPGSGDICTKDGFGDFQLHVEFWLPLMADARGQDRANSGVYLQGRYEVQVLDSYGLQSQDNDCGAIYKLSAPLRNANKKPERWQTYDIAFRAARVDAGGAVKEMARVTVFHNGVMIQNNLELPRSSAGGLDADVAKPGPILLQDHGNLVRYRNIWIMPV